MLIHFEPESNHLFALRSSGLAKRPEFAADQATLARAIAGGAKSRLLAILENIEGWEKGAE